MEKYRTSSGEVVLRSTEKIVFNGKVCWIFCFKIEIAPLYLGMCIESGTATRLVKRKHYVGKETDKR